VINLSQKQSDAWHYLTDNETTEVLYGGGAGGGKSYLGCLWHIDRRVRFAGSRGLIGRAQLKSIKESTLITYLKVCNLLGYRAGVDYKFNGQDMTIVWSNGSKTVFKDLDYKPSDPNFESLGSTEFTDAFIDEAGEIIQKAFDIVNSRIRWMLGEFGLVPKILLTCNPNQNWIKYKYIKNEEGQLVRLLPYQKYVRALVDDNPDQEFKDLYKQQLDRMSSQYDKDRLLFGDWDAMPRTGGEFWKQFNRDSHVKKVGWIEELAVHISWDENVNPYLTCQVWQIINTDENKILRQIDEICLPDPRNRVAYVCQEFKRRYPLSRVPKLFIYGDATSKKEDVKKEKGENLFTEIELHLKEYNYVRRVPTANPSVLDSASFIEDVYAGKVSELIIEIGENCIKSIHDYSYAKEDSDGGISKKKITDPMTKISYEEYGHCSDAKRYFITEAEHSLYYSHRRGSKIVAPLIGVKRTPNQSAHY
jgi:hypothetical protein